MTAHVHGIRRCNSSESNPSVQPIVDQGEAIELKQIVLQRMGRRVDNLTILRLDRGWVLEGHVSCWYEKQLAQHAVHQSSSLPVVENNLVVASRPDKPR